MRASSSRICAPTCNRKTWRDKHHAAHDASRPASPFERSSGYSRAVVDGDFCFVAGTTGYDYATMQMPADIAEQTRNCFRTIDGVLRQAGFSMTDVVRAIYYVVDMDDADKVLAVCGEIFRDIRPAGTILGGIGAVQARNARRNRSHRQTHRRDGKSLIPLASRARDPAARSKPRCIASVTRCEDEMNVRPNTRLGRRSSFVSTIERHPPFEYQLIEAEEHVMSKKINLLAAVAAIALVSGAAVSAFAQSMNEKTVMVGGAAMYPSKNIIQNAVNSKDHTTLVAAVKAAGLVDTLSGPGPFTVFAPTNEAFAKLPAGTVETLLKPENKATAHQDPDLSRRRGRRDGQRHQEDDRR